MYIVNNLGSYGGLANFWGPTRQRPGRMKTRGRGLGYAQFGQNQCTQSGTCLVKGADGQLVGLEDQTQYDIFYNHLQQSRTNPDATMPNSSNTWKNAPAEERDRMLNWLNNELSRMRAKGQQRMAQIASEQAAAAPPPTPTPAPAPTPAPTPPKVAEVSTNATAAAATAAVLPQTQAQTTAAQAQTTTSASGQPRTLQQIINAQMMGQPITAQESIYLQQYQMLQAAKQTGMPPGLAPAAKPISQAANIVYTKPVPPPTPAEGMSTPVKLAMGAALAALLMS